MKLICRDALKGEFTCRGFHKKLCRCYEPHEPHEHDNHLINDAYKCTPYLGEVRDTGVRCECIPVGLEYYMREIIKKEEENDR